MLMSNRHAYRRELVHRLEQLYDQIDWAPVDVGVNYIQKPGHLTNDVEGFDVIGLFTKVILWYEKNTY